MYSTEYPTSRADYSIYAFNKKWPSLKKCCDHYNVCYSSVCSFKSTHKCTNEEAINHYRQLKKEESFYFKKKRWNNLTKCCNEYDLDPELVRAYKRAHNLTLEEALKQYYKYKKDQEFAFNKVVYPSFSACCRAYSVSESGVRNYAKKKHFLLRHALSRYLQARDEEHCNFRGTNYLSFSACCAEYGVHPGEIRNYAYRHGISKEQALEHILTTQHNENLVNTESKLFPDNRDFSYGGNKYLSVSDVCNIYNIDPCNVRNYIKRNGVSREQALDLYTAEVRDFLGPLEEKISSRSFDFEGQIYKNLARCCDEYNISLKSVYCYRSRLKKTKQEAVEYYKNLYEKRKVTWGGVTYSDLGTCCEALNLEKAVVYRRMYYYNFSAPEAIEFILNQESSSFYYEDKLYDSIPECCAQYNISSKSVHSYLFRNNSKDIPAAIDYIRRVTEKTQFVWEDGTIYKSLPVFCKEKGISASSVRDRARKKNVSLVDSAKYYLEKKESSLKHFEYEGKEYRSIPECCTVYEICAATVYAYIYRNKSATPVEAIDYVRKSTKNTNNMQFL